VHHTRCYDFSRDGIMKVAEYDIFCVVVYDWTVTIVHYANTLYEKRLTNSSVKLGCGLFAQPEIGFYNNQRLKSIFSHYLAPKETEKSHFYWPKEKSMEFIDLDEPSR